jgi:hypothetical protein
MDRCGEHALHEVDRIAAAVSRLRELLFAARDAELRADGRDDPAAGPAAHPPLP